MAEEHQLDRIDRMVQHLFAQSGSNSDAMSCKDVREHVIAMCEALASGNLIPAIKEYRTLTGAGLKEAKDAIVAAARPLTRKW